MKMASFSLLRLATFLLVVVLVLPGCILAFRPALVPTGTRRASSSATALRTPSFFNSQPLQVPESSRQGKFLFGGSVKAFSSRQDESDSTNNNVIDHDNKKQEWRQRIFRRSGIVMNRLLNPLQFVNIDNDDSDNTNNNINKHHQVVLLAGSGSSSSSLGSVANAVGAVWRRIKKLHDPKVYMILSIAAGLRWTWMFRSIFYWFAFGFLIKWYRARYVFKIPVWDRQPNWNNVITSKEQEKDLHALTCKNCGSTLFIAKSREFFFEGSTGIGGLGCFTCGAKGKDNFYEDRDRIVEDVADMDDYFEYERPLDLVSAYERRKLLKETKGDEEKANQILAARLESSDATDTSAATSTVDAPETTTDSELTENDTEPPQEEEEDEEEEEEDMEPQYQQPEAVVVVEESKKSLPPQPKPPAAQPPAASKSSPPPAVPSLGLRRSKPASDDDDLDLLGMDDF